MSSKLLIHSKLSDVQKTKGFPVKKEHYPRFLMALENLRDKAAEANMPDLVAELSACINALSEAKTEPMPAINTLAISQTLYSSLMLFDATIQAWAEGEYHPVEIRNAAQFRQILTFWLYEICDYQTKLIYKTLAGNSTNN